MRFFFALWLRFFLIRAGVSANPGGTGGGGEDSSRSGRTGNADIGELASADFSESTSRFGVRSNLTRSASSACCRLIMSLHDSGVGCSPTPSPAGRCGVRAMGGGLCVNWLTNDWLLG